MFWDVAKHWASPGDVILHLPSDGSLRGAQFCIYGGESEWFAPGNGNKSECISSFEGDEVNAFVPRKLAMTETEWAEVNAVEPWGWDRHIVGVLRRLGAPDRLLPTEAQLDTIRELSSRHTAVKVLEKVNDSLFRSRWCTDETAVVAAVNEYGGCAMLKQPWSCSGRGVWSATFAELVDGHTSSILRVRKTLREQGAVEVEPLYECVADFAMEFFADADGSVRYEGLSLFETHASGGYAGNVIAPQAELQRRLEEKAGGALPLQVLAERLCNVLVEVLAGQYTGPLGVDMMLTPEGIHPCIEVNLRNTMGRVAIFQAR